MHDRAFSSFYLSSTVDRPPLRIGILLDRIVDRATASVVEDVRASAVAQPVIVVFDAGDAAASSTMVDRPVRLRWLHRLLGSWRMFRERLSTLAWDLYVELDRRRVQLVDDPLAPVDREAILVGIDAEPTRLFIDGPVWRLPADTVDRLRAARLDVILQLGISKVRGLEDLASYGCWSFRHGDGMRYLGEPPHFWEMVDGAPVTAVLLEQRAETPERARVLASAQFATDKGSLARNRVMPYYGSTFLVIRKLWELHTFGWQRLAEQSRPLGPVEQGRSFARFPTNKQMLRWLLPQIVAAVSRRVIRRLSSRDDVEHWQVAIRTGGPGLTAEGSLDMSGFAWIPAPKGRFYADPFVVERAGRTWLFVEDYVYSRGRGVISCAEVRPDGQLGPAKVVLQSEGHLSYPYVFLGGDDAWMIPESAADGAVRLYRSTIFPDEWVPHAELLSKSALDSSMWRQDGQWWLFTTLREPRSGAPMLWLFHAESLSGPWIFHPMNPISADVRSARGAGLIHRDGGRLIRPSQDGSGGYGSSFSLNEITTLSPAAYVEHALIRVGADWAPELLATHTYNRSGRTEVTDGKRLRARRQVQ